MLKKLQQFTEDNKSFSKQKQSHSFSIRNSSLVSKTTTEPMYKILQKELESLL